MGYLNIILENLGFTQNGEDRELVTPAIEPEAQRAQQRPGIFETHSNHIKFPWNWMVYRNTFGSGMG